MYDPESNKFYIESFYSKLLLLFLFLLLILNNYRKTYGVFNPK